MERTFRLVKRLFLFLFLLLLVAVLVTGIVSAFSNYQGLCDEAAGGQVSCTRAQFALRETFWAAFLFTPFFFIAAIVYLGMSFAQFIASLVNRRRQGG